MVRERIACVHHYLAQNISSRCAARNVWKEHAKAALRPLDDGYMAKTSVANNASAMKTQLDDVIMAKIDERADG